jgi:predicted phage-related endonuclease
MRCTGVATVVMTMQRNEWLSQRSKSIGGSDSPNILSGKIPIDFDHRFGSIHEVWGSKELVRERYDLPMPPEKNDPKRHRRLIQGQKSERYCREYIGVANGAVSTECFQDLYRRDDFPHLHGSIDGELHLDGKVIGLEIKTIGSKGEWWWNGVPFRVELQSRHNWFCRPSLDAFMVVALKADEAIWDAVIAEVMTVDDGIRGGLIRYEQWMLELGDFYEKVCVPVLTDFWETNVVGGAVPLADSTDECKTIIGELYKDAESEAGIDPELKDVLRMKREVDEKYKEVKKEKVRLRNELSRLLGPNRRASDDEEYVYRTLIEKDEFDAKALLVDMPHLEDEYRRRSSYTKLTVSRKKK